MANNQILKIIIILIVAVIIIISGILIILLNFNPESNTQNEIETLQTLEKDVTPVKDRNDFFTVANCIDKYVTYLSTKEKDILYNYLDETYKVENNITIDNVYQFVKTYDDYYKFKASEMYVANLSNNISQYYVYGTLTPESTGDDEEEIDFYISIKLDKLNNTFSVIPNKYIEGLNIKK